MTQVEDVGHPFKSLHKSSYVSFEGITAGNKQQRIKVALNRCQGAEICFRPRHIHTRINADPLNTCFLNEFGGERANTFWKPYNRNAGMLSFDPRNNLLARANTPLRNSCADKELAQVSKS